MQLISFLLSSVRWQVEIVDMHFGTGPSSSPASAVDVDADPYATEDALSEVAVCHKFSKSIFFIVSHTIEQNRIPLIGGIRASQRMPIGLRGRGTDRVALCASLILCSTFNGTQGKRMGDEMFPQSVIPNHHAASQGYAVTVCVSIAGTAWHGIRKYDAADSYW